MDSVVYYRASEPDKASMGQYDAMGPRFNAMTKRRKESKRKRIEKKRRVQRRAEEERSARAKWK